MTTDQLGANTSCLAGRSLQEAVTHIRRIGLRGITLLAFANGRNSVGELAGFWFRDMTSSERQWLKALVVDFDRIVIHSPFADLPLFSYDPRVQALARDRVEEAIDAASYLGAQVVIVHANRRSNLPIQLYWDDVVSTFRQLGEYAADRGTKIGIETGYPDDIDLFVDLLEAVGHHAVGATLDCGHLEWHVEQELWRTPEGAARLNERLAEMVRQLGPMTIHCQLEDVRRSDWRDHRAVGRGIVDFRGLLSALQAVDYEGMLELEIEEEDQATALAESKRRVESILRRLATVRRAA